MSKLAAPPKWTTRLTMTAKTTNDTSRLLPTIGVIITDHTTIQRSATKSPSTKKKTLESSKKKPTPKKEKIHTSKKQCIREDPTQLLEDDNVHTGRKRSNKRRTRKTKKQKKTICLLTYLLTSHCDSNKDAILFPFPALVTRCYCGNSYFAAADQPQALHQRNGQGGTRTHAWSRSSERQRVHVASRDRTSAPTLVLLHLLLLLVFLLRLLSLHFTWALFSFNFTRVCWVGSQQNATCPFAGPTDTIKNLCVTTTRPPDGSTNHRIKWVTEGFNCSTGG